MANNHAPSSGETGESPSDPRFLRALLPWVAGVVVYRSPESRGFRGHLAHIPFGACRKGSHSCLVSAAPTVRPHLEVGCTEAWIH